MFQVAIVESFLPKLFIQRIWNLFQPFKRDLGHMLRVRSSFISLLVEIRDSPNYSVPLDFSVVKGYFDPGVWPRIGIYITSFLIFSMDFHARNMNHRKN